MVMRSSATEERLLSPDEIKESVRGMPTNISELMERFHNNFSYINETCYELRGAVIRLSFLSAIPEPLNADEEFTLHYLKHLQAEGKSLAREIKELVQIMTQVVETEQNKRR